MDELDGDPGGDEGLTAGRRGQEDEQRPQPLASGGERLGADLGNQSRVAGDGFGEPVLDVLQIRVEARSGADGGKGAHRATPVCSATMPPAKRRQRISPKPASSSSRARSFGSGKRRTLAGRYE
jgi:hypothetical protein